MALAEWRGSADVSQRLKQKVLRLGSSVGGEYGEGLAQGGLNRSCDGRDPSLPSGGRGFTLTPSPSTVFTGKGLVRSGLGRSSHGIPARITVQPALCVESTSLGSHSHERALKGLRTQNAKVTIEAT